MYTFTRRTGGKPTEHRVYEKAEADEEGIGYETFVDAEPGGWVLTSDAFVAQCISRKDYASSTYVRLSFCDYWLPRAKVVEFLPFHKAGVYGGTKPMHWVEREARTQRTKRTVTAYVEMLVYGTGIDWEVLGRIYRPDQQIPAATVRRLFKQDRLQKLVKQELRAVLTGAGITEEEVIAMYVDSYHTARDTGKPRDMIQVADRFREMLDMRSEHKGADSDNARLLLDRIARELDEEEEGGEEGR